MLDSTCKFSLGLDWDGTASCDPGLFLKIINLLREAGNKVYIVTMRYESELNGVEGMFGPIPHELRSVVDGVFATGRRAKKEFMQEMGIEIHVWMDDNPRAIQESADQIWGKASPEGVAIEVIHK